LTGIGGEEIAGFDASAFVAGGVLEDVSYNAETKDLTFTWNVMVKDNEGKDVKKTDVVNIADLIDTYTAGHGLKLEGAEFSIKLAEGCESFLSVGADGLKLAGVQDAINTAKQDAIDAAAEAAKKYESKAEASAVYTKEEANALLADKADADSVYTKGEADELLNAKANATGVYTKSETDNLLNGKADSSVLDSYYTKSQADELLGNKADTSALSDYYTKNEADGKIADAVKAANEKLEGIEAGAQVNKIETIKVNGAEQAIAADKAVNITVPTDVAQDEEVLALLSEQDFVAPMTDATNYIYLDNDENILVM
jgi:hypothetical protein